MSKLKEFLEECKAAYYAGAPIISDSQYDALEDSYRGTLDVGTNAGRVKHWERMYSLKKYYKGEDHPLDDMYYVTPKLDGAAIALRYIYGMLDSVVTRGNGEYGEDISHLFNDSNCEQVGIPTFLGVNLTTQITGEICAKSTIENARNYAAGAISLKDPEKFSEKELKFFAYDLTQSLLKSYARNLSYLVSLGFSTVASFETEEYPQDGKVYRVDSNIRYKEMGFTSKHPRGAYALKERTEGTLTTLLAVEWETGKSGKVTPVAILDPVNIGGATVSRATLNNPGFIENLDLYIGDAVMVERAGGIIPRIICKAELEETERATEK